MTAHDKTFVTHPDVRDHMPPSSLPAPRSHGSIFDNSMDCCPTYPTTLLP